MRVELKRKIRVSCLVEFLVRSILLRIVKTNKSIKVQSTFKNYLICICSGSVAKLARVQWSDRQLNSGQTGDVKAVFKGMGLTTRNKLHLIGIYV